MEIRDAILAVEKRFGDVLVRLNQGQLGSSPDSLKNAVAAVDDLISALASEYALRFVQSQTPGLEEDRARLSSSSPMTDQEMAEMVARLAAYIGTVKAEVRRLTPRPAGWQSVSFLYRRGFRVGAGIAAAVAVVAAVAFHVSTRGQGLRGHYYADPNLQKLSRERVDRYINFRWGMGGPFLLWRRDNFSIRWTGFLRVPAPGAYEFVAFADDGFRLVIDNRPILQDWSIHKVREKRKTVSLAAGYHPIEIAYYEKAGQAAIDVYWKKPGDNRPVQLGGAALVPGEEYIDDDLPVFKGASDHMPSNDAMPPDTPDADAEAP